MDVAGSIRKLGFRKWYERELIKGHASLVTCFLCGLTVAAILEDLQVLDFGWKPVSLLGVVFVACALGWSSWRSYITTLQRAERYGERSTCPACHAYARFKILDTGAEWLRVECRKCGTPWRMPE